MRPLVLFLILTVYFDSALIPPAFAAECVKTRVFKGDKAVDLAYVLKEAVLAGEEPEITDLVISTGPVECAQWLRAESVRVMPIYNCRGERPTQPDQDDEIRNGDSFLTKPLWDPFVSKLLWDALSEKDVEGDPPDIGQLNYLSTRNIRCTIKYGGDSSTKDNPRCAVTANWKDCRF